MSTVIGAGRYVFGENIPEGCYDVRLLTEDATISLYKGRGMASYDVDYIYLTRGDSGISEYAGLSSSACRWFTVSSSGSKKVQLEITKSKVLEIE